VAATRAKPGKTARYYRNRERVVDVAVELFSKYGYASTGVADIGDAAGVARGALYYYIGSKEALLAEIHDRVIDPLLSEALVIVGLDLRFESRLRLISESLLWQIVNRQDNVWVFLHEYRHLQGEYRVQFREKRQQFEACIRTILQAGTDDNALRVADANLITLAFLNLHNYTYQWLPDRADLGVEELSSFYCQIFFNGILAEAIDQSAAEEDLEHGRSVLRALREANPSRNGA
jgi:AcrR family transcriptional regulator